MFQNGSVPPHVIFTGAPDSYCRNFALTQPSVLPRRIFTQSTPLVSTAMTSIFWSCESIVPTRAEFASGAARRFSESSSATPVTWTSGPTATHVASRAPASRAKTVRRTSDRGLVDVGARLRALDRGAEADRVGDGRQVDMVDAGSFNAQMAEAQDAAPERLRHANALDIGQRDLEGLEREQAFFFDEAVRGDADLGRPFAHHHRDEDPDPDKENAQEDQRQPGLQAVPPVKMRLGLLFLVLVLCFFVFGFLFFCFCFRCF